jgi:hypothetical protein
VAFGLIGYRAEKFWRILPKLRLRHRVQINPNDLSWDKGSREDADLSSFQDLSHPMEIPALNLD